MFEVGLFEVGLLITTYYSRLYIVNYTLFKNDSSKNCSQLAQFCKYAYLQNIDKN